MTFITAPPPRTPEPDLAAAFGWSSPSWASVAASSSAQAHNLPTIGPPTGHGWDPAALIAELAAGEAASPNPFVRSFGSGGLMDQLLMSMLPAALWAQSGAPASRPGTRPPGRRTTRPVGPTARVTDTSGRTFDAPIQRRLPPAATPPLRTGVNEPTLTLPPSRLLTGRTFSASEALPSGVTVPDQAAAISDLGNWLNSVRASTPEIAPNATALGHPSDWRGGGRNLSTRPSGRGKRVSIGVRGPAASTVADIQRLETFRPRLEAEIESQIRAAMAEPDPMRRDDLISAARESRDRWEHLYFVRTPASERPSNAEKYQPPAAGRHGVMGVDPSPYQHAAPTSGVGSESWVQQTARRMGAVDDPSAPLVPGGLDPDPGKTPLLSEVMSAARVHPATVMDPKATLSGADQQRLLTAYPDLQPLLLGTTAKRDNKLVAMPKTWGDLYRTLHAKYGRAATEDILFRYGFDGLKTTKGPKGGSNYIEFAPLHQPTK